MARRSVRLFHRCGFLLRCLRFILCTFSFFFSRKTAVLCFIHAVGPKQFSRKLRQQSGNFDGLYERNVESGYALALNLRKLNMLQEIEDIPRLRKLNIFHGGKPTFSRRSFFSGRGVGGSEFPLPDTATPSSEPGSRCSSRVRRASSSSLSSNAG